MEEANGFDLDAAGRLLAARIDHTVLDPHATASAISYACREAARMGYAAVCVNPAYVAQARKELNPKIKIAALVGHPFGQNLPIAKAYEAEIAVKDGAEEVDLVLASSWLLEGNYPKVTNEIEMVRRAIGPDVLLKATLLFDHMDEDNKVAGTVLCLESGCDYVVAAGTHLTHHDISLVYDITQGQKGIKASGPIKDWPTVKEMIAAGVTRLGTAWGLHILKERAGQLRKQTASWD